MKKILNFITVLAVAALAFYLGTNLDVNQLKEAYVTPDVERVEYLSVEDANDEYIRTSLKKFNKYLDNYEAYIKSDNPHAINLALGALYRAFIVVDDDNLIEIFPDCLNYRDNVLNIIGKTSRKNGIILSVRWNGENNYLVREENCKPLPGFEYYTSYGKWDSPTEFMDAEQDISTNMNNRMWAFAHDVNTNKRSNVYRLLYEEMSGNRIVKIDVPEEFYYPEYF